MAFVGPFALADTLLDDERFRTCFVTTWRRHLTGVEACADDPGPDVGVLDPLGEVPLLPGFGIRTGGPDEGDTLAVGVRVDPETPEDPELPEGDVAFVVTTVDDWGAGHCIDGLVTNNSAETVVWVVRSPADGTVNNIWNAVVSVDGADWVFSGVDWNASLEPGGQASFGLCADR